MKHLSTFVHLRMASTWRRWMLMTHWYLCRNSHKQTRFQKYPPSIFFSPWFILPLKFVCQPSMHQQKRPVATKIIYCRIKVINNSVKVRSGVSSTPVGYECCPASSRRTPARDELRHSGDRRHLSCLSSPSCSPPVTTHWPHRPPQCQLGSLDTVNHSRCTSPPRQSVTTLAVRHHSRCTSPPMQSVTCNHRHFLAIFLDSEGTASFTLDLLWSCYFYISLLSFSLNVSFFLFLSPPTPSVPLFIPPLHFLKVKNPYLKKRLSLWLLFPSLTSSEL